MNIPEGWPTEEMLSEVEGLEYDFTPGGAETVTGYVSEEMAREIFEKMLSAAPTPPEVEPVAWMAESGNIYRPVDAIKYDMSAFTPLYTSPPSPADDESGGTVEELRHAVTVAQLDKLQLEEELISLKAADDELRKAAEEAYEVLVKLAKDIELEGEEPEIIDNLRAALNKVQS